MCLRQMRLSDKLTVLYTARFQILILILRATLKDEMLNQNNHSQGCHIFKKLWNEILRSQMFLLHTQQ